MASTSAPNKRVAASAFRSVGLIDRDRDQRMRDASEHSGGRKGSSKHRSHRPNLINSYKESASASASSRARALLLSARADRAGPSGSGDDSLSIRGAAQHRPVGRLRRNAVSTNDGLPATPKRGVTIGVKLVDAWREFVHKRYNAEAQFLDLERMLDDETVQKYNLLPPGAPGSSSREASVIFKLAKELKPEVRTISLASNAIGNGQILMTLCHYLPKLVNLSLENNNLRDFKDIDYISGRRGKLESLQELILTGNPIRELAFAEGRADRYKAEVSRRFPSLKVLDREPLAVIAFDAPSTPAASTSTSTEVATATTFPLPMGPSFITGCDPTLVSNFLARFFMFWDSNRGGIIDAYHPAATFSFSANTAIPARARIQGFQHSKEMPNQPKLQWTPWLSGGFGGSRNLDRMGGGVDKMVDTLHVGDEQVMRAIADLPKTVHELGKGERFSLDAWPVGDTLLAIVHGQFTEEPVKGERSFDRSFVLAPSPEGSRAKLNGWDVMILSDQLVVRAYSSHEAWAPGPMRVQAGPQRAAAAVAASTSQPPSAPAVFPAQVQAELASIPEPQKSLVVQVMQRTGLNVKFAVDCLQNNEWDLERAVLNFEQVKGNLSREAYL